MFNLCFIPESYELVSENMEDKDEEEDMAQDNIEIEGSEVDMSKYNTIDYIYTAIIRSTRYSIYANSQDVIPLNLTAQSVC